MRNADHKKVLEIRSRRIRERATPGGPVPRGVGELIARLRSEVDDPYAKSCLAYLYYEFGLGKRGEVWRLYRQAIQMGEPTAYLAIGEHLRRAKTKEGVRLIGVATSAGLPAAQVRLAICPLYGVGIRSNGRVRINSCGGLRAEEVWKPIFRSV